MNQTPPTNNKVSNQDAEWEQEAEAASEENDDPLVQSDEEGIQTDMPLAGLQDVDTERGCDEHELIGDLPPG